MSPSTPATMEEFRLRIDLTGICLYLWDKDEKAVTVLMPDARADPGNPPTHPDGTLAVPHAGYLRFDMKNLAGVPFDEDTQDDQIPSYEVVHRFNCEDFLLPLSDDDEITGDLGLPRAGEFAPVLRADPHLKDAVPPDTVLMRMRLVGGTFITNFESMDWRIGGDLRQDARQTKLHIGGQVTWHRTLPASVLDLILERFDGSGTVTIRLQAKPADDGVNEICLKIANLCGNPLEWPDLETPVQALPDVDFKWLYRLLELRPDIPPADFPDYLCPVPEPILKPEHEQGDLQDCFGLQVL
jgi:hypothetical protein